ncbi:MAG: hypothetical protein KGL99_00520 [Burkholderiales bacterium]|nr:hypothetical protein [Burkholderiales bacterium]MDE2296953.1 hypothetical protein [Burkholderiales bacterium]MDE2625617.1 hypothetical protein [Burkholderiales bacterium]
MRTTAWTLAGVLALATTAAMAADDASLSTHPEPMRWARWQGRLSLGTLSSAPGFMLGADSPALKLASASLMADYYLSRSLADTGPIGGFRATTGLIVGPRSALDTGQAYLQPGSAFSIGSRPLGRAPMPYTTDPGGETTTLPYLGFGYTGLSQRSGWSYSADLGLVAQSPGNAVRLGRVFSGGQNLDSAIRDMRLAPLLQVGVSYAF